MIVLRVVLEDLGLLLIFECSDEVVDAAAEVFAPFLTVHEPTVEGLSLFLDRR